MTDRSRVRLIGLWSVAQGDQENVDNNVVGSKMAQW